MKKVRNLTLLVGFSVALFALGTIGTKAQGLTNVSFAGTFTLPFGAQWGHLTLPPGEYTLQYGQLFARGTYAVAVAGEEKGSPHGLILIRQRSDPSETGNSLICIRAGNKRYVRGLELAEIGVSVSFALPRDVDLMANQRSHNGNTQIAQAPMLIQPVPVKPSGK